MSGRATEMHAMRLHSRRRLERSGVRAGLLRTVPALAALAALLLSFSCAAPAGPPEPKSVRQLLEENSTLLPDLASYEMAVRDDAAERVKKLGRQQGTALILHLLADPTLDSERVEIVLARILASWQDRRAVPYLLQFLDHPDRGFSRNASEGLLEFGTDPQIIAALEEMLASEVPRQRRIAAETLVKMKGSEVFDICARQFRKESDQRVRATLLVAITNNRSRERRRVLIEALDDPYEDVRWLAWRGLQDYEDLPPVGYSPADSPADSNPAERERIRRVLFLWADRDRR